MVLVSDLTNRKCFTQKDIWKFEKIGEHQALDFLRYDIEFNIKNNKDWCGKNKYYEKVINLIDEKLKELDDWFACLIKESD